MPPEGTIPYFGKEIQFCLLYCASSSDESCIRVSSEAEKKIFI